MADNVEVELKDVFAALANATTADEVMLGKDPFRVLADRDRLSIIDDELAEETIAPLTKPLGNRNSVWHHLHFKLMMPVLIRTAHAVADNSFAKEHILTPEQTRELAPYFEDARLHVADYRSLNQVMQKIIQHLPTDPNKLPSLLQNSLKNLPEDDRTKQVLQEFVELLPQKPSNLYDALLAQKEKGINADYIQTVEAFLELLPISPEKLPAVLKERLTLQMGQKETRVNDFWGRLIQTYYAEKERDYIKYGYGEWTQNYMETPIVEENIQNRTIHARTKAYLLGKEGIPNFPSMLKDSETGLVPDRLSLAQVTRYFSDFLRKKSVVEPIHPSFDGAAVAAAENLMKVIDIVAEGTQGAADYRKITLPKIDDPDLLRRMGKLSMAMDALGNGVSTELDFGKMDGEPLMKIARAMWSPDERQKIWGSENRYVPSESRGFESFKQDVAILTYGLALNIEDHAAILPETAQRHAQALKKFANEIKTASTREVIRTIVSDYSEIFKGAVKAINRIAQLDPASARAKILSLPLLEKSLKISLTSEIGRG